MTFNTTENSLALTPEQESVRCTVCGLGASSRSWKGPAAHVATTVYDNSSTAHQLPADHEPVLDNIAPDGSVYPFGRIVATQAMGPYKITTVERIKVDGSVETMYAGYIDDDAIVAEGWSGRKPGGVTSTSSTHNTIDEALAYCIAYRHTGPNEAGYVAGFFIRGLQN